MAATKILVVDDEPDIELLIRQKFAKQLKSKEMEFVFASDGAKALKALYQDDQIHIVLTDINMPEMDGLALLSHLQSFDRILKTVIISAYGDMANIRKAMERGAADFITKPIDFKDLETTIMHAVEQYAALEKTKEAQQELLNLEKEWAIAKEMQEAAIPRRFDPLSDLDALDIYGVVVPGNIAGGDFIDFFPLDEYRLAVVIADISGKSIPAVCFMATARLIIRATAPQALSPAACLQEVNRILSTDNPRRLFARAFYAIYDSRTGWVEFANAGHSPPLLAKEGQPPVALSCEEGIPLGMHYPYHYSNGQFQLAGGESCMLYSDGLMEAQDIKGQEYGKVHFMQDLASVSAGKAAEIVGQVMARLAQFTQDAACLDDRVLFCLKRLGNHDA